MFTLHRRLIAAVKQAIVLESTCLSPCWISTAKLSRDLVWLFHCHRTCHRRVSCDFELLAGEQYRRDPYAVLENQNAAKCIQKMGIFCKSASALVN